MKAHREQLALDQIGLGGLAQPDGHVGCAHCEIELLVGRDQAQMNIRIKLDELPKPRGEPVHANAGRGRHAKVAVRPLAAVGELCARRLQLHEHVMGGVVKDLALLGEDQAARVAMKE